MDFYKRIEIFDRIIESLRRKGGSYKYKEVLDIIKEQTRFSNMKLDRELKKLSNEGICFHDIKDGIIHFKDKQVTPSSDDDGINIPNNEEGG